jgi:hypothetical protein|tara:strand:+ start:368 stop:481 length:114 start_codon:yes stop_codon:yes gene_type:complete
VVEEQVQMLQQQMLEQPTQVVEAEAVEPATQEVVQVS